MFHLRRLLFRFFRTYTLAKLQELHCASGDFLALALRQACVLAHILFECARRSGRFGGRFGCSTRTLHVDRGRRFGCGVGAPSISREMLRLSDL